MQSFNGHGNPDPSISCVFKGQWGGEGITWQQEWLQKGRTAPSQSSKACWGHQRAQDALNCSNSRDRGFLFLMTITPWPFIKLVTRGSLQTYYLNSAFSILSRRCGGSGDQNIYTVKCSTQGIAQPQPLHDSHNGPVAGSLVHPLAPVSRVPFWAQFTGPFHPWGREMALNSDHHSPSLRAFQSHPEGQDLSFSFIFQQLSNFWQQGPELTTYRNWLSIGKLMEHMDPWKTKQPV